jgi:hypothetical protein
MKTILFVSCFLCATVAVGQVVSGVSVLSNQPQMVQFTSNSQRASEQPMGLGQNLLGGSSGNSWARAQGERPLWEVAPPAPPAVPLGDVARMLKKEHATAKKAQFVRND